MNENKCDFSVPYSEHKQKCIKNKGHKGDHVWKGFAGSFQPIAMKISWENKKDIV